MKVEITVTTRIDDISGWSERCTVEGVGALLVEGKPNPLVRTAFNLLALQFCEHKQENAK